MNTQITWEDKYLSNTEVVNTGKSTQKVGYLHIADAVAEYETNLYKDEQSSGEDSKGQNC